MKLPFEIEKSYTTYLTTEEVMNFIRGRLKKRKDGLFGGSLMYFGSLQENSFRFYKVFNARTGPGNPTIRGTITEGSRTTIAIRITPHYFRILFFMLFPCVFIPEAILMDSMSVNGVLRVPDSSERIWVALFGGVGPLIWCYFDSIRPIHITEKWLKSKLKLEEK